MHLRAVSQVSQPKGPKRWLAEDLGRRLFTNTRRDDDLLLLMKGALQVDEIDIGIATLQQKAQQSKQLAVQHLTPSTQHPTHSAIVSNAALLQTGWLLHGGPPPY